MKVEVETTNKDTLTNLMKLSMFLEVATKDKETITESSETTITKSSETKVQSVITNGIPSIKGHP